MGACVVNGIGAGPAETIMPAVIADIFFLHDRGKWNTLYWVVYMGSLMIGPIISGVMTEHSSGWRSFWWLNTGLLGLSLLMVVFMFPETKWTRAHPVHDDAPMAIEQSAIETEKFGTASEIDRMPSNTAPLEHIETAARDPYLGKGSPSKAQWRLFTPNAHPFKSILLDLWIPWKLFAFPIVEFASFVVSWSCSSFLTLNLTQSQAFSVAPYHFSAQSIGTSSLPTHFLFSVFGQKC
jgi:MFS family permease